MFEINSSRNTYDITEEAAEAIARLDNVQRLDLFCHQVALRQLYDQLEPAEAA